MKYWFKSSDRFARVWNMVHDHYEPTKVPPMKLYKESAKILAEVEEQERDRHGRTYMWLPVRGILGDPYKAKDFRSYADALKEYLLCEYFECYYGQDNNLVKELDRMAKRKEH